MPLRSRIATLYVLGFALDLASMFVLNAALPALKRDLGATVAQIAWVGTINILGLTMAIPLGGWAARRLGERRVFVASLIVAVIGAGGAMVASGIGSLLAWRLVQGLGGGLLVPVGQAMAYRAYPPERRASLTAVVMGAGLIVPACAPAIGGVVTDLVSWRWIFGGLVLISTVTAAIALTWLPADRADDDRSGARFDAIGFVLTAVFLSSLPAGLTLAGQRETLMLATGLLLVTLVSGTAYLRHHRTASHPLVALDLIGIPSLRAGALIYLCVPGTFTGVNLVASLYLQGHLQISATDVGALMLPWAIASFAAIFGSRRFLATTGARPIFLAGMVAAAAATLLLSTPLVHSIGGRWSVYAALGFGASLCTSTAQTVAFTVVPAARIGEASTLWSLNRQLSFMLGNSVLAGVLSGLLTMIHADPTLAYQLCFIVAAALMMAPLPVVLRLEPDSRSPTKWKRT